MALALDIEITGCANNVPVEVLGTGKIDGGRLRIETRAPHGPLDWDPLLSIIECMSSVRHVDAADEGDGDLPVLTRTWTVLHDEQGREVGRSDQAGLFRREGDRLLYRAQISDCRVRFEVLERVVRVETPFHTMAMPFEHRAVMTSAWAFATGRGSRYAAVTTATCDGDREAESTGRSAITSFKVTRPGPSLRSIEAVFSQSKA